VKTIIFLIDSYLFMFPEYQTKSSKFRFDKYTTIRKLYEEAYKQKIDENFTKAN